MARRGLIVNLPGGTVEAGNGLDVDVVGNVSTLSIDIAEIITALNTALGSDDWQTGGTSYLAGTGIDFTPVPTGIEIRRRR